MWIGENKYIAECKFANTDRRKNIFVPKKERKIIVISKLKSIFVATAAVEDYFFCVVEAASGDQHKHTTASGDGEGAEL
jgi:hypothetical protein